VRELERDRLNPSLGAVAMVVASMALLQLLGWVRSLASLLYATTRKVSPNAALLLGPLPTSDAA